MFSIGVSISIKGEAVYGGGGETFYLLAQNGDNLMAQNGDYLLAQNGAPPDYTPTLFVLGGSYNTNEPVFYINTSGLIEGDDASYILTANKNLRNYAAFDIADWNIISTKVWVKDSTNLAAEKYEIFPGDIILVSDTEEALWNDTAAIVTSDLVTATYPGSTYVNPLIALLEIDPFVLGEDYAEDDFVRYTHTSGLINPVDVDYILRAKAELLNYTPFVG